MKGERFLKFMALALAVAAVAMSLHTWLSASRHREILDRKQQDLDKIRSYSERWANEDAIRDWLDARQAWKPVDLESLARQTFGNGVEVTARPASNAVPGWQSREMELKWGAVSYAAVAGFLAEAADFPPPWRIRKIEINPSAAAGQGAMTLQLEALEKKQP